jgi:hypothetical protein
MAVVTRRVVRPSIPGGIIAVRIDPETVYIELTPSALILNLKTQAERYAPAVTIHWKPEPRPGTKWERVQFLADDGESLGGLLDKVGAAIDAHEGLDRFLTECEAVRSGERSNGA